MSALKHPIVNHEGHTRQTGQSGQQAPDQIYTGPVPFPVAREHFMKLVLFHRYARGIIKGGNRR